MEIRGESWVLGSELTQQWKIKHFTSVFGSVKFQLEDPTCWRHSRTCRRKKPTIDFCKTGPAQGEHSQILRVWKWNLEAKSGQVGSALKQLLLTEQGECGIVPGKLKSTANCTIQGFLFLEKVILLAQHKLWVLLPGGVVGPPRRCQYEANFTGIWIFQLERCWCGQSSQFCCQ